jgi:hypothetical protein
MDFHTFWIGTDLAVRYGAYIAIGGGEPTLHPRFWKMLRRAMYLEEHVIASGIPPFVATNGSQTKTALKLARMTEEGQINAVLSLDEWHDPIDPRVVQAFQRLRRVGTYVNGIHSPLEGVRSNTRISPHGSALATGCYTEPLDTCCCSDMLVYPDGKIFGCGCRKVRFGTVFQPRIPDDFEHGECAVRYVKQLQDEKAANAIIH